MTQLGSLIYDQPLQLAHAVGEMVTFEPGPGDSTAPSATITSPLAGVVVSGSPMTVTGTATDNIGVSSVGLAIYRGISGGQYWNGTGWQNGFIRVPTILSAPNAASTNWSYSFVSPPGGSFAINATAFDSALNYGFTSWVSFSVADTTVPVASITSPPVGQVFAAGPVGVAGTATDNAGVFDVQVVVWRSVDGGQYWNGSAWQAAFVAVPATLADRGAASSGYTYSFSPGVAGGYYYVAAVAIDTNYNVGVSGWHGFSLTDSTLPTVSLTAPAENVSSASPLTITGSAGDDTGVLATAVAVYRTSTGQYWNGSGWQTAFAMVPATTASPGAVASTFSATVPVTPPGTYLVAGFVYDTNYNYKLSAFRSVNVT